jgi:ADP-ribosylglycohydrolase
MSPQDTVALVVAAMTVIGSFIGSVKWLVKHYLSELKPNSGSSMRDQVNRLEARVDTIISLLEKR